MAFWGSAVDRHLTNRLIIITLVRRWPEMHILAAMPMRWVRVRHVPKVLVSIDIAGFAG
jgi:hypothetical protein